MELNSVNCLFCALPCSPDFLINKSDDVTSSSPSFELGGEDAIVEEHLKAIFILRKILKIPQEMLCQFLGKGNGQFYPEFWFNVCESCGESVTQFYGIVKQVSKLERKLAQIQTELKGKIEGSKDVENNDFICQQIRHKALNLKELPSSSFTEDLKVDLSKTERKTFTIKIKKEFHSQESPEDDDAASHEELMSENIYSQEEADDEKWHSDFNENHQETFDEHDDDDDDDYHPASDPLEDQASCSDYIPDDDDEEEEEIEFFNGFISPSVQTTTTFNSFPSTTSGNSKIAKKKGYFYSCSLCSYQSNTKADFEAHLLLHEPDSGAITCKECRRPVLPQAMANHCASHVAILEGYHRYQRRSLMGTKRENEIASSSNQSAGKFFYQCGKCPWESNSRVRLGTHLKLHEEGSGAVRCSACGYFVEPTKLARHLGLRHFRKLPPYKRRSKNVISKKK